MKEAAIQKIYGMINVFIKASDLGHGSFIWPSPAVLVKWHLIIWLRFGGVNAIAKECDCA